MGVMNSFFRQLGSVGGKSQARMRSRAVIAQSAAAARAPKQQARVHDRAMAYYKSKNISVGQAAPRAMERSEQYVATRGSRAYNRSLKSQQILAGKRRAVALGGGMGAVGIGTAMRPNSDQQQTMYRGPMNTGRGIGRYS